MFHYFQVDAVLNMLAPLICDQPDQVLTGQDAEDFAEEQNLMARLIHLLAAEESDLDQQYRMLTSARKQFGAGGARRIPFTLPPLIYEAFKLARKYFDVRQEVCGFSLLPPFFTCVVNTSYKFYRMNCGRKNARKSSLFVINVLLPLLKLNWLNYH
jgi:hypothetical protein